MNFSGQDAVLQQHFLAACELDVIALKPGNVRLGTAAHGMQADDFLRSAQACAPALARRGASVGQRILEAIRATQRVVRCNTNLGIVLLAAPLFGAAQAGGDLRLGVAHQLATLDRSEAELVYQAIRLARPGGMGTSARHDLAQEPQVSLLEAMREAQGRDSIARLYVQGFGDLFDLGLPQWDDALARFGNESWAATHLYLVYLSTWRDSLIERKFGTATAQAVLERARQLHSQSSSYSDFGDIKTRLLAWDEELRSAGVNPGTSADLTVATVFAAKLTRAV
ncbi:MAG TPA: triphosphoribosyl-dephospho-CoA synthase [Burkholderiaceae bacterium]|jgi:triphosphoribosyl-dephospho-CoA synthase|nr:triphosphoribosyl-dephospho-CoA synthase [Burkholderiaceae bacterium]